MFEINGRKIKVRTGPRSQTVNICTSANIHGVYDSRVRLRPPFTAEDTLRQANFNSTEDLVRYLCLHHSGQIEPPTGILRRITDDGGTARASKLAEKLMARDIHDLLKAMGLKPHFRADICSGIAGHFPAGTYDHNLPVYAKQIDSCSTQKARQIARPDLIVVDTVQKIVEATFEFELDTNPKNLVANYFYVFLAQEYKAKADPSLYKFDVTRTSHFLLACLNSRSATPNEQAALEKGVMVAKWLNKVGASLAGNADLCNIRIAHALAGDDWQAMKQAFARALKLTCPHLFDEDLANSHS
jgi:hypothetical protein